MLRRGKSLWRAFWLEEDGHSSAQTLILLAILAAILLTWSCDRMDYGRKVSALEAAREAEARAYIDNWLDDQLRHRY